MSSNEPFTGMRWTMLILVRQKDERNLPHLAKYFIFPICANLARCN